MTPLLHQRMHIKDEYNLQNKKGRKNNYHKIRTKCQNITHTYIRSKNKQQRDQSIYLLLLARSILNIMPGVRNLKFWGGGTKNF